MKTTLALRKSHLMLAGLCTALALALPASTALARDDSITSFDGTRIMLSFFPAQGLQPGQKAPTVLVGPGWGVPRDTDQNSQTVAAFGAIGLGPLRAAGYNVLTWDPRGFGQSGGTVEADSPDFEARDASALVSYVARQPEALLDKPGDPRVGMAGASYGGGIQLVTAAIDPRVDAITPDIAWNSLVTSLYKAQSVKAGWSNILFALGIASSTIPGLPAGQTGNLDPHIVSAYQAGLVSGQLSDEDVQWFASRGPGSLVGRIHAPTLLTQGTADTLFTLDEAIRNYAILRRNRVASKMVWFCGGHGACFTSSGPSGFVENTIINWFARYLKRDRTVDTGRRFQWIADDGQVRTANDYPLPLKRFATGTGSGTLAFTPDATGSGTPIAATPGTNAVRVPIAAPAAGSQIVGAPKLSISYSGLSNQTSVLLYAQIVDNARHVVVGNVVTPFRVVLDGAVHTATVSLEDIAASVDASSSYTLEVVPYTAVYGPQRAAGAITMARIDVSLPVASTP